MWHQKRRRRLGVKTKHRKALLRNLVRGLAFNRQIETTYAKAKETARFADQMVTLAKVGTLHARRQLIRHLGSHDVASLFIERIAPRLQDRKGGYTRVLRTGLRPGDGAQKALVEFSVPIEIAEKEAKRKKEKQGKPVKPHPSKAAAPVKEEKRKEEKQKPEKKPEETKETKLQKEETQKRGGFLSKLRKFLTGEEEKK